MSRLEPLPRREDRDGLSVHVVSHTHWDREWYEPFEVFRLRLVELVDGLLDILEQEPAYAHFMLDGQTVVLEDYLSLRPENATRLEGQVRAGRLQIGPWYVLPDEALVSGESLIRNLARGMAQAERFGGPMPVGYVPDTFGHSVDLPTILTGFGLGDACLWRGVGEEVGTQAFRWQAPSGASVLVAYLATSYSNAVGLPDDPDAMRRRIDQALDELEPFAAVPVFLLMNGSDHQCPVRGVGAALRQVEANWGRGRLRQSTLTRYLEELRTGLASLRAEASRALPMVSSELRNGRRAPVLPGTLSSRIRQKQRNRSLELLLTGAVEPAAVAARLTAGVPYPHREIDHAWGLVLRNHAHDSICGCSVDVVHREVETRFDRAEQVARTLLDRSLGALAASARPEPGVVTVFNPTPQPAGGVVEAVVPDGDYAGLWDEAGLHIALQAVTDGDADVLFDLTLSPLQLRGLMPFVAGREIQGLVVNGITITRPGPDRVSVELVMGERAEGDLDVPGMKAEVVALLADRDIKRFRVLAKRSPVRRVIFCAKGIPGLGLARFRLAVGDPEVADRAGASARARGLRLENEHLVLTVNRDGTFDVVERHGGRLHRGLHRLVDGGDCGDLYNYCPPPEDRLIDRPARAVRVRVIESGPVRASLEIAARYRLPVGLTPDRRRRSVGRHGTVDVPVVTRVSLIAGEPVVHLKTVFDNHAGDHRLRAVFPTPAAFTRHFALSHCSVVEREAVEPVVDPAEWLELPSGTWPNHGFFGCDGMAVFTRGLPEYGVVEARAGSSGERRGEALALTLVRSVGWLSREDLATRPSGHAGPAVATPEGQSPGRHELEYGLCLLPGDWRTSDLVGHYQRYSRRLLALPGVNAPAAAPAAESARAEVTPITAIPAGEAGGLEQLSSGEGPVVAMAVRMVPTECGERLVVRLANLSETSTAVRVGPFAGLTEASFLDFGDRPVGGSARAGDPITLGPWQVVTLGFDVGGR